MDNKIDTVAEDIVINLLKLYNHEFIIKPPSSTNPNWDIVEFKLNKTDNKYEPIYYQIKSHKWTKKNESHVINANFTELEKNIKYLIVVIIKNTEIEIYKFDISNDIREKRDGEKDILFGNDGKLLYSKPTNSRKDKRSTITLNNFYDTQYNKVRKKKLKYTIRLIQIK